MISDLKAIGFDIDNTLYFETKEIRALIQNHIITSASKLLGREYSDVKSEYNTHLVKLQSGRRALEAIGIKDGVSVVQDALENTDVASTLKKDEKLISMINNLSSKYILFIITGSRKNEAIRKLNALGLDLEFFSLAIFADSSYYREDGSAFKHISSELDIPLNQMMFVGDRENVDILPANNLGMMTAIVNNPSVEATYQLKDIYDLEKILL